MSAWVKVITYSEFNHLIYTIRSSIRNQSHMPRSRTQQKQLTSSLVSAPLIPSDTCTLILTTSIFLSLIFSHPRLLPDKYRTEWSTFRYQGISEGVGNTGYMCRERYNALTKTGNVSLDNIIIMCSNRNVDKCNDSDQVFCRWRLRLVWDQSREIGTRNYEKDKHIQALIVELYLHVPSVN